MLGILGNIKKYFWGSREHAVEFPGTGELTRVNRPFAAKPSRDLLFIKLWAATLRMPEMEKACRKHQNGQV